MGSAENSYLQPGVIQRQSVLCSVSSGMPGWYNPELNWCSRQRNGLELTRLGFQSGDSHGTRPLHEEHLTPPSHRPYTIGNL